MKFSDEQLSAFLDNELAESEMQEIREAIALDENIAMQIATLAEADIAVINTYSQIDKVPLPESVLALLAADSTEQAAIAQKSIEQESVDQTSIDQTFIEQPSNQQTAGKNVIQFPIWKRATQRLTQAKNLLAAAAVAALVVGLNVIKSEQPDGIANFANVDTKLNYLLSTSLSGQAVKLEQRTLLVRASFSNQQGEFCRQFFLQTSQQATENIACLQSQDWQLVASASTERNTQSDQYQTASAQHLLDKKIDSMINGSFYNAQQEQDLIQTNWMIKQ